MILHCRSSKPKTTTTGLRAIKAYYNSTHKGKSSNALQASKLYRRHYMILYHLVMFMLLAKGILVVYMQVCGVRV
jgi:hypothetical protein